MIAAVSFLLIPLNQQYEKIIFTIYKPVYSLLLFLFLTNFKTQ